MDKESYKRIEVYFSQTSSSRNEHSKFGEPFSIFFHEPVGTMICYARYEIRSHLIFSYFSCGLCFLEDPVSDIETSGPDLLIVKISYLTFMFQVSLMSLFPILFDNVQIHPPLTVIRQKT